jgi:hypothetical protein
MAGFNGGVKRGLRFLVQRIVLQHQNSYGLWNDRAKHEHRRESDKHRP